MIRLAIDAMGGDQGPQVVIPGISYARKICKDVFFLIYGNPNVLEPLIAQHLGGFKDYKLIATEQIIPNDMLPSVALRKRDSSMRLAVEAVKSGEAEAVVSSGNTGAYMAISKVLLRTLPGIDRPAIAKTLPTLNGASLMLDLGANVDCAPMQLVQFALMGQIYAQKVFKIACPSVALLNIGAENQKGNSVIQAANQMIRETACLIDYHGYIEGDEIFTGRNNVIVTDGFTGNVALKTAEGTYKVIQSTLKEQLMASWMGRLGGLLCMPAMRRVKQRFDPSVSNGAPLLGLNGIAVKSHGSADTIGFAYAIKVAVEMVQARIHAHLGAGLTHHMAALTQLSANNGTNPVLTKQEA